MQEFELQDSQSINSNCDVSTFRFRQARTKKYMLHKMMTKSNKQFLDELRKKIQKKEPQYLCNMLKQQKKKLLVTTFIKKLKNSITLNQPPKHSYLVEQDSQYSFKSFQLPKNIEIAIQSFLFIQIIGLIIFNSLTIIFIEVQRQNLFMGYNIFSFGIHLAEIAKRLLIQNNYKNKKNKYFKQEFLRYINSQDFILDCCIILAFLLNFILDIQNPNHHSILVVSRIAILSKIKSLFHILSHMELILLKNQYRVQLWSLIKVFLFNFVIAHFLTIMLISMTKLSLQKNWMVQKGIDTSQWIEQYIWGYYWAVTIMLTVGFGDITPINKDQALCMIFIQIMSCIVLAYNINRVGGILSRIKSYDEQRNLNAKIFNQISDKSSLSSQLQIKISNYIKESTFIKRNYNIEEQQNFINKLPTSFKDELLKETNKRIWNGMMFFQNFSERSLIQLSKCLQKKLTHPQQIIYCKGQQIDIMIFNNGKFGLSYNNGYAKSNGKILETYSVSKDEYRIASLDFLFVKSLNYNIKCIDYAIFYKISLTQFKATLENYPYDYQYYFMIKDRDKFILNQFQITKCSVCLNQRHTLFKCPRLHYIPLKQHIIEKHKMLHKKKHLNLVRSKISLKRQKYNELNSLKQRKYIKSELIKKRITINANRSQSFRSITQLYIQPTTSMTQFHQNLISLNHVHFVDSPEVCIIEQQKNFLQFAVDRIKQNFDYSLNFSETKNSVWELQCDLVHNFKFYFKQFNAQQLCKRFIKKGKSRSHHGLKSTVY